MWKFPAAVATRKRWTNWWMNICVLLDDASVRARWQRHMPGTERWNPNVVTKNYLVLYENIGQWVASRDDDVLQKNHKNELVRISHLSLTYTFYSSFLIRHRTHHFIVHMKLPFSYRFAWKINIHFWLAHTVHSHTRSYELVPLVCVHDERWCSFFERHAKNR